MKVSVLIPVYNKAHCVERCVMSIVNQTYKDLEILVYDDGSTDDSVGVVHAIKDRRIRIIQSKHNTGISNARNVLMREATGAMSAWQDADDYSNPWRIETQMAMCKACGVVTSRVFRRWISRVSGKLDLHPAPSPVGVLARRGTFCSQLFPSRPVIPFHLGLQLNHELLWEKELEYKYGHHAVVRAVYYYYSDEEQPYRMVDKTNPLNSGAMYWHHKQRLWGRTLKVLRERLQAQGYLGCEATPIMTADDLPEYTGDVELDLDAVEGFRKLITASQHQPQPMVPPEEVA